MKKGRDRRKISFGEKFCLSWRVIKSSLWVLEDRFLAWVNEDVISREVVTKGTKAMTNAKSPELPPFSKTIKNPIVNDIRSKIRNNASQLAFPVDLRKVLNGGAKESEKVPKIISIIV